jgi:hypothetical protein
VTVTQSKLNSLKFYTANIKSIPSSTYRVQKSGANRGSAHSGLQTETMPDRHLFCSGHSGMLGQQELPPQELAA